MSVIAIDAGHGGTDEGGQSIGTPESLLVLRYALRLGRDLKTLGHRVVYTRTQDVYVGLGARAQLANEANADLFVSLHANASASPSARGPWTLYAKGSVRGLEIAGAVQRGLAAVLGGSPGAVYSDATSQVGYTSAAAAAIRAGLKRGQSAKEALAAAGIDQPYRTLAVLRQTRMPAVLIELGFMTDRDDLAQLESPSVEVSVCAALAESIHEALTGEPPLRAVEPELAAPPAPDPGDNDPPLILDPIQVPRAQHFEAAATRLGIAPGLLCSAGPVVEAVLRAILPGQDGARAALAAELLGALAEYRKSRCDAA